MTLIPRAEWFAQEPRGALNEINPHPDGSALHWEGPGIRIVSHNDCYAAVAQIQHFHMGTRGWSDIAYNLLPCIHGDVFVGRGPGIGSAANGTNDSNARFYAICALVGVGDELTPELLTGIGEAFAYLRSQGAGPVEKGHRDFISTTCPGDELYAMVHAGKWSGAAPVSSTITTPPAPVPAAPTPTATPTLEYAMDTLDLRTADRTPVRGRHVDNLQGLLLAAGEGPAGLVGANGRPDGIGGPGTQAALGRFQVRTNTGDGRGHADYVAGANTWRALIEY